VLAGYSIHWTKNASGFDLPLCCDEFHFRLANDLNLDWFGFVEGAMLFDFDSVFWTPAVLQTSLKQCARTENIEPRWLFQLVRSAQPHKRDNLNRMARQKPKTEWSSCKAKPESKRTPSVRDASLRRKNPFLAEKCTSKSLRTKNCVKLTYVWFW